MGFSHCGGQIVSDAPIDAIREVSWQIGMLLKEHEVPYDIALSALCVTMKQIAVLGRGMDEAAANAWLASMFTRRPTAN